MKPRIRRQPGRPRLLWTAARTTECYGSVRPALRSNHRTTRLLSQLLSKITYYNRCCCAEQSHKDNVRSSAVGKQLKQKRSNSLSLPIAQLQLPTLDPFWANFFVRVKNRLGTWHLHYLINRRDYASVMVSRLVS